jgi:RNA polymerase sigma-70 factor (ECF subfamily)
MRATAPAVLSDEGLARRAAEGEALAADMICRRHRQHLVRVCAGIVDHPEDAEDAAHAALEKALAALARGHRVRAVSPWLGRIARNEALNLLRRRGREAAGGVEAREAGEPAEDAEWRARAHQLALDLHHLPAGQRAALALKQARGLRYAEIAEALAISEGAARQAVFKARRALEQLEAGRRLPCGAVRAALERDRRSLRSRAVAAHLRACAGCRALARRAR